MKIGNLILKECPGYDSRVCEVGPKEAEVLLERNVHNRPISEITVDKYVDEILRGVWVPTNSGIGFSEDGELVDGQHRLAAIKKSDCKVKILIVYGLPKLAQEKSDRHKKRTLAEVFWLSGVCGNKWQVQTATYIARRESPFRVPTDEEVKEAIFLHRNALEAVEISTKGRGRKIDSVGTRTAIVFAYELYGDRAITFYESLQSDLHSAADSPAHRLRKFFLTSPSNAGGGAAYQDMAFKKTCYAFNAFIQGKKITCVLSADSIVKPEK